MRITCPPLLSAMRKRLSERSMADALAKATLTLSTPAPLKRPTATYPLLAALYYILTASSLTLFNKLLFSRYPASHPPLLLLSQSVTAVCILTLLHLAGRFALPNILAWRRVALTAYAPLFLSNLCMLLTSLLALNMTSLLMYNTLRRTSMIFVVAIHSFIHSTRPTSYTIGATALVTLGAFIAGTTDLAFDLVGYALAFAANMSTAMYLVLLRPVRDKLGLGNLQLIYVNALANIPVISAICILMPPDNAVWSQFSDIGFCTLFFFSCSLAVVINHAIFVNTTTNDAIAQTVSAQLKDILLLVTSVVFVDDAKHRAAGNLPAVFVGFLGSVLYGVGKVAMSPKKTGDDTPPEGDSDTSTSNDDLEREALLVADEKPTDQI